MSNAARKLELTKMILSSNFVFYFTDLLYNIHEERSFCWRKIKENDERVANVSNVLRLHLTSQ